MKFNTLPLTLIAGASVAAAFPHAIEPLVRLEPAPVPLRCRRLIIIVYG